MSNHSKPVQGSMDHRITNHRPIGSFKRTQPKSRHNFSLTQDTWIWLQVYCDDNHIPSVSEFLEQIAEGNMIVSHKTADLSRIASPTDSE
jgi:hypothetical protein